MNTPRLQEKKPCVQMNQQPPVFVMNRVSVQQFEEEARTFTLEQLERAGLLEAHLAALSPPPPPLPRWHRWFNIAVQGFNHFITLLVLPVRLIWALLLVVEQVVSHIIAIVAYYVLALINLVVRVLTHPVVIFLLVYTFVLYHNDEPDSPIANIARHVDPVPYQIPHFEVKHYHYFEQPESYDDDYYEEPSLYVQPTQQNYHVGPRGGVYYYNKNGNKQYVKRR